MTPPPTVSLAEFAEFQGEIGGIEIASALPLEPYIPGDEININLGRIARAASAAHLGSVEFGRYTRTKDQISPDVANVHDDGSATASLAATASRSPRTEPSVHIPGLVELWNEGDASIKINFGHPDLDDAKVREAKPWAQLIDKAISEGLRWAGNRKLVHTQLDARAFVGTGCTLSPAVQMALIDTELGAFSYAFGFVMYNGLLVGAGSARMNYFSRRGQWGSRFKGEYSLTPGIPFDRLAFLHAYSRIRKFAEVK
jgi:hypothetical protein